MHHLSLTLDSPAENLALDEALLDAHEAGEIVGGVLRLWESPSYAVVLGRSSSANLEANLGACRQNHIPVLRRCSGGGTIVAGPGCLMYAVVLDFDAYPQLRAIDLAHNFVLGRLTKALAPLLSNVAKAGTSDLIIEQKTEHAAQKFSGNALRIKRNHLLYHGTLLYNFDLNRIHRLLGSPTRQPEYRNGRRHNEFIANLPTSREDLEPALVATWNATKPLTSWPRTRVTEIVQAKYAADPKWTVL